MSDHRSDDKPIWRIYEGDDLPSVWWRNSQVLHTPDDVPSPSRYQNVRKSVDYRVRFADHLLYPTRRALLEALENAPDPSGLPDDVAMCWVNAAIRIYFLRYPVRSEDTGLLPGPLTEQDVLEELLASVEHPNADAQRITLARLLLLHLMRQVSEEAYCAGWLSGLTGALYQCVEQQSTDFGMGFSEDLLALLTATQAIAGGWWVQDLDAGIREPVFVEEWTPDE